MINAVIFDLDGLLFNTEIIAFKIYEELGERFGFTLALPDFMENFCGQTLRRNVAYCNERFQLPWSLEEAVEEVLRIEKRMIDEGVDVMPGAKELLIFLKENNYKTAVASSSIRERAIKLLEQHELIEYFDDFVFGPEVKRGKPNPDIFLIAAQKLQVEPEHCLVLEDSQAGIQAAYCANMRVICVPDLKYPTEEYVEKATYVKESLYDVIPYLKEVKRGYPGKETAESLLVDAVNCNLGPWGDHCRIAAQCAEKIAFACGMDGEKAYVLGLLHDIGRKFLVRDLGHLYNGYKYMNRMGYPVVAKICLSHSFPNHDIKYYIGKIDIPEEEANKAIEILNQMEFDDYDRLIQICDALASAEGVVDIEERMADVKRRYGNYPQEQWDKNVELKQYFEAKAGRNIYEIVG